jgi:hypothetical protein
MVVMRSLCAAALRSWSRLSFPEMARAMFVGGLLRSETAVSTVQGCNRRWRAWRADPATARRAWEIEKELMHACGIDEPICDGPPQAVPVQQDRQTT